MSDLRSAARPEPDQVLVDIADYVCNTTIDSDLAYETAHYWLVGAHHGTTGRQ